MHVLYIRIYVCTHVCTVYMYVDICVCDVSVSCREPSKPIANLRQPSKIGMFSSFEKMMMTIKEGAPRGVQESTPITEHNNVVGVCNEPMVKNSWFKFVSEVPQKEVIVETGNGQEGNPATYQQALEHNLDYLCGELAECSQNPSMKTTREEIDEIPLKEKRMYCSALEEVSTHLRMIKEECIPTVFHNDTVYTYVRMCVYTYVHTHTHIRTYVHCMWI